MKLETYRKWLKNRKDVLADAQREAPKVVLQRVHAELELQDIKTDASDDLLKPKSINKVLDDLHNASGMLEIIKDMMREYNRGNSIFHYFLYLLTNGCKENRSPSSG